MFMTEKKVKTSFTLSQTGKGLLEQLSEWYGISMSAVVEMLARKAARAEGLLPGATIQLEGTDHERDRGMAERPL